MTAVPVSPWVWRVGSSDPDDPAFTSRWDCSQYLLWTGQSGIIVDSGTGMGIDRLWSNIADVVAPERVGRVFVTHYHADHAAGAAGLRERGLTVLSGTLTSRALAGADEDVTQLARARRAGIYPESLTLTPCEDVVAVADADAIALSDGHILTAYTAPGHCDGHMVLVHDRGGERTLFSGDVVLSGGRVSIQAIPDCRLVDYAGTLEKMEALGVQRLMPGHGAAVTVDAGTDIARAARSFRALAPPPNAVLPVGYDDRA